MEDTGDRRINFRIYAYSPPVSNGYDLEIYSQILVWPEEYWENMLTGEYQIAPDSDVEYITTPVNFSSSRGCFRLQNIDLGFGEPFRLNVSMANHSYEYEGVLPDINLQGHFSQLRKVPGDSIRYRWSSDSPDDGKLIIRRGGNKIDTIVGSGVIVWYIHDGYSGSTYDLEFIYDHEFSGNSPFRRMNYEYRAYSTLIVL
jgi:hypothetical protein